MAITTVQKNALTTASGTSGVCPAWGSATTAGNLLLIIINELGAFTGTWSTPPSGYTAFAPTPFIYWTTPSDPYGIFWKIAAGSDATPANVGADSGVGGPWLIYTYEFSAPNGWLTTPNDAEAHSAAGSTAVTTIASGSTAALAQANELAVAVLARSVAGSAMTPGGSWAINDPASGADIRLTVATQETAATTALTFSPTWTTSARPGARIATFKTAAAAAGGFAPFAARAAAMGSGQALRYQATRSRIFSIFDNPAVVTPRVAPVSASRRSDYYRGSYAAFVGAGDQLELDPWSAVTKSRPTLDYLAPRSVALAEFFAATVTPDTWASLAQSRSVPDYTPPRSQALGQYDQQSIWANTTTGRSSAFYAPPRQVTSNVFDPLTNSYRDWAPPPVANRPTLFYDGPASLVAGVFFSTPFVSTDTWINGPTPRQAGAYRGSYSLVAGAVDQLLADTFALVVAQRPTAFYSGRPSRVESRFDNSPVEQLYASSTQGRPVPFYTARPSRVESRFDNPAAQQLYTASTQGRAIPFYSSVRSVVSNAGDQPLDSWTQVYLSRRVAVYLAPLSQTIAADVGAAAPDTFANVTTGRSAAFYRAPSAHTSPVLDNALVAQVFVALTQGRRVPNYLAPRSLSAMAWVVIAAVPGNPGGGGFGAQMGREFLSRYKPGYEPGYRGEYRSTLRKKEGQ